MHKLPADEYEAAKKRYYKAFGANTILIVRYQMVAGFSSGGSINIAHAVKYNLWMIKNVSNFCAT